MVQNLNYSSMGSPSDKNGILEQIEPQKDVQRLVYSMLGLTPHKEFINGIEKMAYSRISKPLFTYEYVMQIKSLLDGFLSYSVQVSRWEDKRIKRHAKEFALSMVRNLAIQGDDNYISEKTWKKILDVHSTKDGWDKFGIKWDFDKSVNHSMLQLVRDANEEAEQAIVFVPIVREIIVLVEGSLGKGYASYFNQLGMMPTMLGEMRTESTTIDGRNQNVTGAITGGEQQWK